MLPHKKSEQLFSLNPNFNHPEKNPEESDSATEIFKAISNANDILNDLQKRTEYNLTLPAYSTTQTHSTTPRYQDGFVPWQDVLHSIDRKNKALKVEKLMIYILGAINHNNTSMLDELLITLTKDHTIQLRDFENKLGYSILYEAFCTPHTQTAAGSNRKANSTMVETLITYGATVNYNEHTFQALNNSKLNTNLLLEACKTLDIKIIFIVFSTLIKKKSNVNSQETYQVFSSMIDACQKNWSPLDNVKFISKLWEQFSSVQQQSLLDTDANHNYPLLKKLYKLSTTDWMKISLKILFLKIINTQLPLILLKDENNNFVFNKLFQFDFFLGHDQERTDWLPILLPYLIKAMLSQGEPDSKDQTPQLKKYLNELFLRTKHCSKLIIATANSKQLTTEESVKLLRTAAYMNPPYAGSNYDLIWVELLLADDPDKITTHLKKVEEELYQVRAIQTDIFIRLIHKSLSMMPPNKERLQRYVTEFSAQGITYCTLDQDLQKKLSKLVPLTRTQKFIAAIKNYQKIITIGNTSTIKPLTESACNTQFDHFQTQHNSIVSELSHNDKTPYQNNLPPCNKIPEDISSESSLAPTSMPTMMVNA